MKVHRFSELVRERVLRVSDGYRAKNAELGGAGPIFLRGAYLQDQGFVLDNPDRFQGNDTSRFGDKIAAIGDTIITTKGNSTGRVGFVDATIAGSVYSPHLSYWRSLDRRTLNPRFLHYWSRGPEFADQLHGMAFATDMAPYLSLRDQMALLITFPDIGDQDAIAAVLGALDDKIELNRRMNRTLEAMARALFRSWFVDFDPVHAKAEGRAPAHMDPATASLFPARFSEDGLPEGWTLQNVTQLTSLTKGRSYKSAELANSDTALITLKSFQRGGGYRSDGLKPFTGKYKDNQIVAPGELVISLTDVTQAAEVIGRATFAREDPDFPKLVASLDVGILRARDPASTPAEYLHQLFNSEAFLAHAMAHVTGTTVLHLSKDAIPTFKAAAPTKAMLKAFGEVTAPLRSRIVLAEKGSNALTELRDVLLPKLMSGELRVRDAERALAEAV